MLRNRLCGLIAGSGLHRFAHRQWFKNELAILMYHGVVKEALSVVDWCFITEAQFRREMTYLASQFDVVSLSDAIGSLRDGAVDRPKAVVTFDDGFHNNYDVAFPILSDLGLPATIFLVTGMVATDDTLWFCRLHRALVDTERRSLEWKGTRYDLSTPDARAVASSRLQEELKTHRDLSRQLDHLVDLLGDDPERPVTAGSPYRMLTREAIKVMVDSKLVEFGAHTVTHPLLTQLSENEMREEILRSIHDVREITESPCRFFAYPNGHAGDYDLNAIDILESSGVLGALTTISGPNTVDTPTMELHRYGIGAGTPRANFECTVHHALDKLYKYLL